LTSFCGTCKVSQKVGQVSTKVVRFQSKNKSKFLCSKDFVSIKLSYHTTNLNRQPPCHTDKYPHPLFAKRGSLVEKGFPKTTLHTHEKTLYTAVLLNAVSPEEVLPNGPEKG